jgi:hypothetical protein
MDSEISGLENRHAFLKLGNNVARFQFDYMDMPQRTRGFVARDMEDDALCFDPLTLVPKAQAANALKIDLEAEVPKVKQVVSPKVEDAVVPVGDEPTEEELAEAATDPDSPMDSGEDQDEVGVQSTLDFVGR